MKDSLVSCIIPCYNRPGYVRDAIDSALAQTYPALEVLVVDDGSTDNTPEILASYGDKIRVIRQENAGTATARNAEIAASQGEYLAWLDSDDAWLPQKIDEQVRVMEHFSEAALVYTLCWPMDTHGEPRSPDYPIPVPAAVLREDILSILVAESQVLTPSCLVRREALDAVGWFDPSYSAEDWELNLRLARRYAFAYIHAPLTRHRIHEETESRDREPHAHGLLKLREAIEGYKEEFLTSESSPAMHAAWQIHTRKYAAAHYRVGRLYQEQGDLHGARDSFRAAILLDPSVFRYRARYFGVCVLIKPGSRSVQSAGLS